jgi:hypothetical protein
MLSEKIEHDFITHPTSNIVAVYFRTLPNYKLSPAVEKKYGLAPVSIADESGSEKLFYTFFFTLHITKAAIAEFIAALS